MANYKVIQDIEAEDRLVGPLTMRQLFYALAAAGIIFVGWLVSDENSRYLIIPFVILSLPLLFLALPLGRDQSNDVWLLAQLNFLWRPRKRLWIQEDGSHQSPIIKKKEDEGDQMRRTDGRTTEDVEAEVRNLTRILDSRGHYIDDKTESPMPSPISDSSDILDEEHEKKHRKLGHNFHKLLHLHRENRKKSVRHAMRRTLRSQSHNLYTSGQKIPAAEDQSLRASPPSHLSARISEVIKSEDLKISTLESMVKTIKSKRRLQKNST